MAWAFRDGDSQYGVTWHRMDAELDTGPILAQAPVPMEDDDFDIWTVAPRTAAVALGLLPSVLERVAAVIPGTRQPRERPGPVTSGMTTGPSTGRSRRGASTTRSRLAVRSGMSPVAGPVAELDGRPVRLTRTSLVDPGGDARRVEAGDGPIWIVGWEPVDAPDVAEPAAPA